MAVVLLGAEKAVSFVFDLEIAAAGQFLAEIWSIESDVGARVAVSLTRVTVAEAKASINGVHITSRRLTFTPRVRIVLVSCWCERSRG